MRLEDLYPGAPLLRERLLERFWSKVDVRGEGECWPWTASIQKPTVASSGGYGRFGIDGNRYLGAHRVAFMLANGGVPDDLAICHSCDNPACCNPGHLWAGTKVENNADRDLKGRTRNRPLLGTANGRARLTEQDVLEIRERWCHGETPYSLAKEFGVDRSTVSLVATGSTWRHLPVLAREAV